MPWLIQHECVSAASTPAFKMLQTLFCKFLDVFDAFVLNSFIVFLLSIESSPLVVDIEYDKCLQHQNSTINYILQFGLHAARHLYLTSLVHMQHIQFILCHTSESVVLYTSRMNLFCN